MQLEERVFSKKEFVEAVGKEFVLLEVDFPNKKKQSDELVKQNDQLQKAFGVRAFPTLMLCDAEGRPYAEQPFPDEFTIAAVSKGLVEQKKVKAKRDAAFAAAEKAEGVEKAALLVKGLKLVPAVAVSSAYAKTVDEVEKLDPTDKSGFVKSVRAQQALAGLEESMTELMETGKSGAAIKLIDSFLEKHKPEGEVKQKALLFKLFGFANEAKNEAAVKVAEEIVKIDAKTETGKLAAQIKQQLE